MGKTAVVAKYTMTQKCVCVENETECIIAVHHNLKEKKTI